jgi:hypothetical protein
LGKNGPLVYRAHYPSFVLCALMHGDLMKRGLGRLQV